MPIELSEIISAMEDQGDLVHAYFDRHSSQTVTITEDDIAAARNPDWAKEAPDWQRENIAMVRLIEEEATDRFVPLPDRFEINEWKMMERFALSLGDSYTADALLGAIRQRGAFRRFKDMVYQRGLADRWYAFRDEEYRRVAIGWCREHGIELHEGQ